MPNFMKIQRGRDFIYFVVFVDLVWNEPFEM